MTLTLTRTQRSILLFLSASSLIAWFSGTGGRGLAAQDIESAGPAAFVVIPRVRPPNVLSVVRRDPFAGGAAALADDDAGTIAPAYADSAAAGDDDLSVPDIAVAQLPQRQSPVTVRATIVGSNPIAYVETGSAMDIVRVGDTLGNRRIVAIDLRGISFDDRSRLDLPDGDEATPSPVGIALRTSGSTPHGQRSLPATRALPVSAPTPLIPASASTPLMPAAAAVSPAPLYPTPGPLRTVDRSGLQPGANPTPDRTDPTAFPYPYPYAPLVR
jgi:hypothetical protein